MSEAQTNWTAQYSEISESEFWDDMIFAPIKRMGFSNGPGAVFHGEPYDYRTCPISRERTVTRMAHFVVKDGAAIPHYYRWNEPVTLEEFKALCASIIPGVGPCEMGWGQDL